MFFFVRTLMDASQKKSYFWDFSWFERIFLDRDLNMSGSENKWEKWKENGHSIPLIKLAIKYHIVNHEQNVKI